MTIASYQRQKEIVCVLIENGADVNCKNNVSILHFVDILFTITEWRNSFISSLPIWISRNSIHFAQKQSFVKFKNECKLEHFIAF